MRYQLKPTELDGFDSAQLAGDDTMAVFPLSSAQFGMWYAQHLDPDVPINIAQYVDLRGDIDVDVLERASIVGSTELGSGYLRILEVDDRPCQAVDLDFDLDDSLIVRDFRGEPDPERAAREWMRADYSTPVDLLEDRLIVAAVLPGRGRQVLLVLALPPHHPRRIRRDELHDPRGRAVLGGGRGP